METLEHAKQIKEILESLNSLKTNVILFLGVIALFGLAYFVIKLIVNYRRAVSAEESKNKRAEIYADGISKIASTTSILTKSVDSMKLTLETLNAKVSGRISVNDSRRMIEHRFNHDVKNSIFHEFGRSFAEDNFKDRRGHVERLVKTNIGRILTEARDHLCLFNMSVDPVLFFELVSEAQRVERFVLCELIWEKVSSLYERDMAFKLKIEESQVLIENTISDYLTQLIARHVTEKFLV